MKKKPRRLFRNRSGSLIEPVPQGVRDSAELLRKAKDVIDPDREYVVNLPDGKIVRSSGRQLMETAENMVSLVDAQIAGDEEAVTEAVLRILEEIDSIDS